MLTYRKRLSMKPTLPCHVLHSCKVGKPRQGSVFSTMTPDLSALPQIPGVEYRFIPDFPMYAAGTDGSIWSFIRRSPVQLKPYVSPNNGRCRVTLKNDTITQRFQVHVIITRVFIGPCPEGMEVCHFPENNPQNNAVSNLMYGTKQTNWSHRYIHGTDFSGERNPCAKLTAQQVLEIRAKYIPWRYSLSKLAQEYGVDFTTISLIIRRKKWAWLD